MNNNLSYEIEGNTLIMYTTNHTQKILFDDINKLYDFLIRVLAGVGLPY